MSGLQKKDVEIIDDLIEIINFYWLDVLTDVANCNANQLRFLLIGATLCGCALGQIISDR